MRRIYLLLFATLTSLGLRAQSTFSDDFESYSLGAYVGQASPNWTTWSGTTGGPEDAQVVNTQASSGTQSIYFNSTNSNGGPQDVVLPFGGAYNTGTFGFGMDMYVETGKGAYFNFQANQTVGQLWALECYMNHNGQFVLTNTNGTFLSGTYPTGAWFRLVFEINLNTNNWEVFIDNVSQGSFANTVNQIASIDIYPSNLLSQGGNGQSTFWVDNVTYTHTPYVLPTLNAAVVAFGAPDPATLEPGVMQGLVGQQREVMVKVRNLGQTAITSFDVSYNYGASNATQTVTGVNIPSLGFEVVTFTTPLTLVPGTINFLVTVSNPNGQLLDGDPSDDAASRNITTNVVAAANKLVVAEEGTGTWCQWCPRGAIYMDFMEDVYGDWFAGIAVHNQDPMAFPEYDGNFSAFLTGYPGVLMERGTEIDPLDMEVNFLNAVQAAPAASIQAGATWDAQSRTLDVSLTYTVTGSMDDTWRVACVLTEDSVTGTTVGYNQQNAYGNNNAGPMGGFEDLGTVVPAAQMNYNHVARALSPNFQGATGFPAVIAPGSIHTFNFQFVLPAAWDEDQIHIVGMLIDGFGEIDNGTKASIAEAISNGFVTGTPIVGVDLPAAPDALVQVYPNPSHGLSMVSLNLPVEAEVDLNLRDLQGRSLQQRHLGTLSGGLVLPLQTEGLAKGIYLLEVRIGDSLQAIRVVVE